MCVGVELVCVGGGVSVRCLWGVRCLRLLTSACAVPANVSEKMND